MATLRIGELAERAGITPPAIRLYERVGLLAPPPRSSGGYRRYPERSVEELRFIKKAQGLGFSLEETAEILRLSRSGRAPCSRVLSLGRQHLAAVEARLRQLHRFRDQLAAELGKWNGKTTPTCHGLCQIIATAQTDAMAGTFDNFAQRSRSTRRPKRIGP